ncbi:methylated-DNA--[protein]-cysteine S-methyltransferase [Chitinophaga pollutisoli]|uniref:Methylated-DNA--protein-cysteine methyltransferase n=1 Tax=Chitinophaga pollutisoli TaxID=3133966 RepID=A0ABZ2YLQ6_9BACT
MSLLYMESPAGRIEIRGTGDFISRVAFLDADANVEQESGVPVLLKECAAQLDAYFKRQLRQFDLPLQQEGTPFRQQVWQNLLTIPYGETITYLALAKRLGNVKSIRAAGTANGKNDIAIIVPCHRVIGVNGELTGYAGGLWRKQFLLELEKGGRLF